MAKGDDAVVPAAVSDRALLGKRMEDGEDQQKGNDQFTFHAAN
jgi:hypothetical protein